MGQWFCVYDVVYYDDDEHFKRHNKGLKLAESFSEVIEWAYKYFGKDVDSIHLEWLEGTDPRGIEEPKRDLNFSESEFDRFEVIKTYLADNKDYYDWERLSKEYQQKHTC